MLFRSAGNEEAWQEFINDYFQGSNSADTENPLSDDYSYFIVYLKENTDGEALAQYITINEQVRDFA